MSEPSELTRRIKKLLGELFRFSWELPGPHTPARKDDPEAPKEEKQEKRAMVNIGYGLR